MTNMAPPKGVISKRLTMTCGGEYACTEWMDCGNTTVCEAAADARRGGWKFTKERGWLCPECAKEEQQ